jgi:hypothetical protein
MSADPAAPAIYPRFTLPGYTIVQARFPRSDADLVVNTFIFQRGNGTDQMIVNRLENFYFGIQSTNGRKVADYLSPKMQGPSYYMRDADQEVGSPGRELPGINVVPPGEDELPPDLAVCASYRAALPNSKRRRGRIYMGPLRGGLVVGSPIISPQGRVNLGIRVTLNAACSVLAGASATNPVRWVIASRVGNTAEVVRRGYVNPHFDTMRSRDPHTEFFGRAEDEWDVPA